jgi:hypothetical protein
LQVLNDAADSPCRLAHEFDRPGQFSSLNGLLDAGWALAEQRRQALLGNRGAGRQGAEQRVQTRQGCRRVP